MEDRLDKENESYLDGLLETLGQEPPYETDRRRKATARAKSGNNKVSSKNETVDSLEEEFNIDDLKDSFLDDMDLDNLVSPFENETGDSNTDTGGILSENETDTVSESDETVNYDSKEDEQDMELQDELLSGGNNLLSAEDLPVTGENTEETAEVHNEEKTDLGTEIAADIGVELGDEIGEELGSEIGVEIGEELGGEIGVEIGEELGGEIGVEIGEEFGSEISAEIGTDEEDEAGEISLDEASPALTEDSMPEMPEINPLDDIGEPEVLSDEEIKSVKPVKKPDKEKKGFFAAVFHKLFANVPLTEEEIAAIPTPEQEEAAKKEKAKEAAKKKEEKKAAAEAGKRKKAEEAKKKAADNKAKKAAKDAAKKAAKKEAELKRLRAEALEQPEGKINKAGAVIIFLFFAVAAAVVIVGTNIFSYDISIANATYKFGNRKYTEAYEDIRGFEIKEKDMEIHDKIYTVMFVNKQLNSYNNFFAMGDYSSALDSLIKGLSRYNKYIALARQLGIHTDLDYVRKQIMAELQSIYGIPEREALDLMGMVDRQEYSERIYGIVSKLDTKAIEAQREKNELVP